MKYEPNKITEFGVKCKYYNGGLINKCLGPGCPVINYFNNGSLITKPIFLDSCKYIIVDWIQYILYKEMFITLK